MAVTRTDRGSTTAGAVNNATRTCASGSFTPAAGSLITAAARGYWGLSSQLAFVVTDNFGDSGGTAWSQATHAGVIPGGVESFEVAIWTRRIGTSPSAGTVTATRSAGTTYWDIVLDVQEWAGQDTTTPIPHTATNTTSSGTTLTLDFGVTPASTSGIFSAFHGASVASPAATVPSGFTALDNSNFDTDQWATAYKIGSASQTHQWATGASADGLEGCAIEIAALATGGSVLLTQIDRGVTRGILRGVR